MTSEEDCTAIFNPLLAYTRTFMRDCGSSAAAVIILRNGQTVMEWYEGSHHFKKGARTVGTGSMFNIYSVRKTYVGLATAIAAAEGAVTLDAPVSDFVRDISRDELGGLTLRHLATKTGPKYFGADRIEREQLAGKAIEAVTGRTIAELLTEKVLEPLRLGQTDWVVAPREELVCDFQADGHYASVRIESNEGHERNLYVSARDLALWGHLHLKRGKIGDRQLLAPAVFDLYEQLRTTEETHKRLFGWYFARDWQFATGAAGCHCVVVPEFDAVGVRMLNRYTVDYEHDVTTFNRMLYDGLSIHK